MNVTNLLKVLGIAALSGAATSVPIALQQSITGNGDINWTAFAVLLAIGATGGAKLGLQQAIEVKAPKTPTEPQAKGE